MGRGYEDLCVAAEDSGGRVRLARIEDLVGLTVTLTRNGTTQGIGFVNRIGELDEAAEFALAWMRGRLLIGITGGCGRSRRTTR